MGAKSFSVDDVVGLLRGRAVEVDEGCRVCSADLPALAFLRALWKLGSKAIDHTELGSVRLRRNPERRPLDEGVQGVCSRPGETRFSTAD